MGLVDYFRRRRPLRRALGHWLERHQHPFNFWIHLIGIPLALAGVVLLFTLPWDEWYWGIGGIVGGYLLQWLGHAVEGNDMGEWAGIKRLLGLPYVAVSPRWHKPAPGPFEEAGHAGQCQPSEEAASIKGTSS